MMPAEKGTVVMRLLRFRASAFLFLASAAASAAPAQHPRLLKRYGIIYGVRDIAFFSDCKGMSGIDACQAFRLSGTITAVARDRETHEIDGFILRTARGRRIYLEVLRGVFPAAASSLLQVGNRIFVSGTIAGHGRVATPNEIIRQEHR